MKRTIQKVRFHWAAAALRSRYWARQGSGQGAAALAVAALASFSMAAFVGSQILQSRARGEEKFVIVFVMLLALTTITGLCLAAFAWWASSIAREMQSKMPEKRLIEEKIEQMKGRARAERERGVLLAEALPGLPEEAGARENHPAAPQGAKRL